MEDGEVCLLNYAASSNSSKFRNFMSGGSSLAPRHPREGIAALQNFGSIVNGKRRCSSQVKLGCITVIIDLFLDGIKCDGSVLEGVEPSIYSLFIWSLCSIYGTIFVSFGELCT